jgi:hypothetical protein
MFIAYCPAQIGFLVTSEQGCGIHRGKDVRRRNQVADFFMYRDTKSQKLADHIETYCTCYKKKKFNFGKNIEITFCPTN